MPKQCQFIKKNTPGVSAGSCGITWLFCPTKDYRLQPSRRCRMWGVSWEPSRVHGQCRRSGRSSLTGIDCGSPCSHRSRRARRFRSRRWSSTWVHRHGRVRGPLAPSRLGGSDLQTSIKSPFNDSLKLLKQTCLLKWHISSSKLTGAEVGHEEDEN